MDIEQTISQVDWKKKIISFIHTFYFSLQHRLIQFQIVHCWLAASYCSVEKETVLGPIFTGSQML